MDKIRIIEKTKGMEKKGAIKLLKYHQELRQTKENRLEGELLETSTEKHQIMKEIERREKGGENDAS